MENYKLRPGEFKQIQFGLGNEMYLTGCVDCGAPVKTWVKRRNVEFRCQACRERIKEEKSALKRQINKLTLQRRVEAAKEIIIKQCGSLEGYGEAIDKVNEKLYTPFWFQSINEALVAMELLRTKTKARHQVKMGRWRVDFILPEINVVLEIDGGYHNEKTKKERDAIRDAAIIANLGPKWEIIRIKDNHIRRNIQKLVPAIKKLASERRRLREKRKGELPVNYI